MVKLETFSNYTWAFSSTQPVKPIVQGKIEETFRSKNLTSIPPAQQRVIFCGQILTPETLKVKEIQNIADGAVSFAKTDLIFSSSHTIRLTIINYHIQYMIYSIIDNETIKSCSLHLVNRGPIDLQRPTVQPSRHEATQNRFQPYAPARPTTTPAGTGYYHIHSMNS